MFRFIFLSIFMIGAFAGLAQDPASLMEEGRRLEQKLKDDEAFEKYKQALAIQPGNLKAMNKCAELSLSIGGRQADLPSKDKFYRQAKTYVDEALKKDSNNVEANFLMSAVCGKITETEKSKEQVVRYVRDTKLYADKAIALNPDFGKGYYALGRWHLEVMELNSVKKAALKVMYGGLPDATIADAIANMEKCKSLEPYYCANFLDLAKAYHFDKKYEKAISVLEQLAKLPTRRQDDVAIKAEGAALLQKLQ